MTKTKIKLKLLIIGSLFILITIILWFSNSNAYYTNINKYFSDSRIADGYSGFALQRYSNEFIVDGCGSGTMLDTLTGLCWDKNMNHNGSMLQWSTVSTTEPVWNNVSKNYTYVSDKINYPAFSYCEDLILGGNTDWRLPSLNELNTLLDEIGASGATCTTLTGFGFTNCQNNYYWGDDGYTPAIGFAWNMNMNDGIETFPAKTSTYYVICVR